MNKVILASGSPRRKELLAQIGLHFIVCKSTCEEKISSTNPQEIVCELSRQKAEDVFYGIREGRMTVPEGWQDGVVIGADTIVSYAGKILGKPKDKEDAYTMLSTLSGNTHEVYTGVTFCWQEADEVKVHTFYEKTDVVFYPLSEQEILAYVETKKQAGQNGSAAGQDGTAEKAHTGGGLGSWDDKAGGYGIQEPFGMLAVKEIRGDYNNVVGLPVGRLYQELKECFTIEKSSDI